MHYKTYFARTVDDVVIRYQHRNFAIIIINQRKLIEEASANFCSLSAESNPTIRAVVYIIFSVGVTGSIIFASLLVGQNTNGVIAEVPAPTKKPRQSRAH